MLLRVFIRALAVLLLILLSACAGGPGSGGSSGKESSVKIPTGQKSAMVDEAELSAADQIALQRAVAALNAADFSGAIAEFKGLSLRNPKLAMPYINLAIAYRGQNDTDAAMRSVIQALNLSPNSPEAHNLQGVLWRDTGEFTKARDSYAKALGANGDWPDAQLNLGILCDLYLQDLACAKKHYEAYLDLSDEEDRKVKGWLIELERRMKKK